MEALLGLDFIQQNGCVLDPANRICRIKNSSTLHLEQKPGPQPPSKGMGLLNETVHIPPRNEIEIAGSLSSPKMEGHLCMIEQTCGNRRGIYIANAAVIPNNGSVPLRILNPRPLRLSVYKGETLALIEELDMRHDTVVTIHVTPVKQRGSRIPVVRRAKCQKLCSYQ